MPGAGEMKDENHPRPLPAREGIYKLIQEVPSPMLEDGRVRGASIFI